MKSINMNRRTLLAAGSVAAASPIAACGNARGKRRAARTSVDGARDGVTLWAKGLELA